MMRERERSQATKEAYIRHLCLLSFLPFQEKVSLIITFLGREFSDYGKALNHIDIMLFDVLSLYPPVPPEKF